MNRYLFSANLGFLWTDRSLPDAIRAAAATGFDAVELHWPFETPAQDVKAALAETGLPCLGLNTVRGDVEAGDFGLAALPGREDEAQAAIDQALAYASEIEAGAVHVMAGKAEGPQAERAFEANLEYALGKANGRTILIEPINPFDAPGYFLRDTVHAAEIIARIGSPDLKLMFDCYHVARGEGDVLTRFSACRDIVGHVQFAGVPDRGDPGLGDLDYAQVFATFADQGWREPLGAEYKPVGPTDESLGWLRAFQKAET